MHNYIFSFVDAIVNTYYHRSVTANVLGSSNVHKDRQPVVQSDFRKHNAEELNRLKFLDVRLYIILSVCLSSTVYYGLCLT